MFPANTTHLSGADLAALQYVERIGRVLLYRHPRPGLLVSYNLATGVVAEFRQLPMAIPAGNPYSHKGEST